MSGSHTSVVHGSASRQSASASHSKHPPSRQPWSFMHAEEFVQVVVHVPLMQTSGLVHWIGGKLHPLAGSQ